MVTDRTTDGWLNLPRTEASYNPSPPVSTAAQTPRLANIWLDAFVAASLANPDFLLRQQTPPPFGGFDAVVVIETTDPYKFRARNLMTKPIADRVPIFIGGALGVLGAGQSFHAAVAPPELDLAGGVTAAFATVFPTGFELAAILPGFFATLDNTLFKQGSVVVGDIGNLNGTGVWAHELGHSLFGFWDYYGTPEPFVRGDTLQCVPPLPSSCSPSWGLMASGDEQNPPPITTNDKAIAGWLTNVDTPVFGFGDYPLAPLKDTRFGSTVLRFQPPKGPIDWFIVELRMPPDDVPLTPEHTGVQVNSLGEKGVVIYAKREARLLEGRIPSCGDMTGPQKLFFAELMGADWLSCLDKITNTGEPSLAGPDKFTLLPNTSYTAPESGVVFTLSDQFVLSIRPLD
jgi:hypothetical protein